MASSSMTSKEKEWIRQCRVLYTSCFFFVCVGGVFTYFLHLHSTLCIARQLQYHSMLFWYPTGCTTTLPLLAYLIFCLDACRISEMLMWREFGAFCPPVHRHLREKHFSADWLRMKKRGLRTVEAKSKVAFLSTPLCCQSSTTFQETNLLFFFTLLSVFLIC